jgi:hypothetical protein
MVSIAHVVVAVVVVIVLFLIFDVITSKLGNSSPPAIEKKGS